MRIIFVAILFQYLGITGLFSQQIVVEHKIWSNVLENCGPDANSFVTFYNKFKGDTMINGLMYKKVWLAEDEFYQDWYHNGSFIREENNKVYLLESTGKEGLIYDFGLEEGDSVVLENPLAPDGLLLYVTTIDSVETFDGFRKRWKLIKDEFSTPEYWIEGVGSNSGVLNSGTGVFGALCGTYTLLCEKENDITIYQNPEYGTCFYVLLAVSDGPEFNKSNLSIRYARDGESISIVFTDKRSGKKSINLYNIFGGLVLSKTSNEPTGEFLISALSPGLYVATLTNTTVGLLHSEKILVR